MYENIAVKKEQKNRFDMAKIRHRGEVGKHVSSTEFIDILLENFELVQKLRK